MGCFSLFVTLKKIIYFTVLVQKLVVEKQILPPGQDQYICTIILNMPYDVPQPVMFREQKYVNLCFHSHGLRYSKALEFKRLL